MSKQKNPKIWAKRNLRLPLLAFAVQKCELQPDNIMIGLLELANEKPNGLTVNDLNQVLFGGARSQLAEQMLKNGLVTGELQRDGDRYLLTEYGQINLRNKQAWLNEQTASWELLCLGSALSTEVDGVMRHLSDREKIEAGWKPLKEWEGDGTIDSASEIWDKVIQKIQLQVLLEEKLTGVLLVNEFAEPPKPSPSNIILARKCLFEVLLDQSNSKVWTIVNLEYKSEKDEKHSAPFNLPIGIIRVAAPADDGVWRSSLESAGVQVGTTGELYCTGGDKHEVIDYVNLIVPRIELEMQGWSIIMQDIPLRTRDRQEGLDWFAHSLANTCGKSIMSWNLVRTEAQRFLSQAGCEAQELSPDEVRLAVLSALAFMNHRGNASRLGYILDFEEL
jgi:hypothetical protein